MSEPLHARLAPSAASRWSTCTASVGFIEKNKDLLPVQDWSYADEGTNAHILAAARLLKDEAIYGTTKATPEMFGYVEDYAKFVLEHVEDGDKLFVERRTSLFYSPDQRGTLDVAIKGPKGLYIIDLKYGAGVSVEAKDNKQLAIYAESFIRELEMVDDIADDMLVTLCIYQPRDRNNPNPIRLWPLTRAELRGFCNDISEAVDVINFGTVQFVASPDLQCRFCPATSICKAYAAHCLQVIPDSGTVSEAIASAVLPDPDSLTREQRCKVIAMTSGLTAWMEAVKAQEVSELSQGAEPLLFKLVAGKSNRQWKDPLAVEKLLRNYLPADAVRPPGNIVSPAQAEALLKGTETSTRFENRFQAFIEKPEGKPTLAPIADKRPALDMNPTKDLENYDII